MFQNKKTYMFLIKHTCFIKKHTCISIKVTYMFLKKTLLIENTIKNMYVNRLIYYQRRNYIIYY